MSDRAEHICNFCSKRFTTKSSLNFHIKTNKKCINIRGEEVSFSHSCEKCNKKFTIKSNYTTHSKNCKVESKLDEIQELKNKLNELTLQLENKDKQLQDKDKIIDELTIYNNKQTRKIVTLKNTINKNDQEYKNNISKICKEHKDTTM